MRESDAVELSMIELLLLQDIINSGGLYFSSLIREKKHIDYIVHGDFSRNIDKYEKYLRSAGEYPNNILYLLTDFNQQNIFIRFEIIIKYLLSARLLSALFRVKLRVISFFEKRNG